MKKIALILSLVFSSCLQAISTFPQLSLYTLKGDTHTLPSGQKEIVFVGCKAAARHALIQWYHLFCEHQSQIERLGVMVIPVFPAFMANRLFRSPLITLIRQRIPDNLSDHVAVLFSNSNETASLLQLSSGELDTLQVYLVDENGKILWKASGEPTAQSIRQLKQFIEPLSTVSNKH